MDFEASTGWWVLAGLMVLAELLSGTFYLLMMAVGAAAAALAAHAGMGTTGQLIAAALVGGGATAFWHLRRARHPRSAPADRNADVNLDIGQSVMVQDWDAQGLTSVRYRGASWSARHAAPGQPTPGPHRIVAVHGNRLDLAPQEQAG
ncbi:MAG: NfeD family protein [Rubrivivax sp.]|jgi:membrane protein implicated in regulation of membrane protease activity